MYLFILKQGFDASEYNVNIWPSFDIRINRNIRFVKLMSQKTVALPWDRYEFGIETDVYLSDEKSKIINIHNDLGLDTDNVKIRCEDYEPIFGAGLDYTNSINVNILNASRVLTQDNEKKARIKLTIQYPARDSSVELMYRSSIPSGLPKLNFQTPIKTTVNKRESSGRVYNQRGTQYRNFKIIESDIYREPIRNYEVEVLLNQSYDEAAQIEKFYYDQEADPYTFTQADYVYLFPDQLTGPVIITDLETRRLSYDRWQLKMKFVRNL